MHLAGKIYLMLQTFVARFGPDLKTQICIKQEPYNKVNQCVLENSYTSYYEFLQCTEVYIDKSRLLQTLLTEQTAPIILITAPPKWGKSMNLKMIKFFFEWEIDDEDYRVVFHEYTNSHKFFYSGKFYLKESYGIIGEYDKAPLISKFPKLIDAYAGRYPVIYLEMNKIRPCVANFNEFFKQFKETIRDLCEQHAYLARWIRCLINYKISLNQTDFTSRNMEDELEKFEMLYRGKTEGEDEYKNSLVFLSYMFNKYYHKKTIILIDEYDSVFKNLYLHSGQHRRIDINERNRIQTFLLDFYDLSLRGNRYLYRSILTGILPTPITISTTGFNDLLFVNYADLRLYPYYGFSEDDFRALCYHRKIPKDLFKEAYEYYRGYHIDSDRSLKIFNPWSIAKFINTLKPDNYWTLSEASIVTAKLKKHDEIRNIITDLVYDQCVTYLSWQQPTTPDSMFEQLATLEKLTSEDPRNFKPYNIFENLYMKRIDIILWYLHANGFLTLTNLKNQTYCMRSPNYESKALLASLMTGIHVRKFYDEEKLANSLIQLMPIERERPDDIYEFSQEFYNSVLITIYGNRKDQYEESILLDEMIFHFALHNVANLAKKLHKYESEVIMTGLTDSPHLFNITNCTNFVRYPNIMLYKDLYGILIGVRRFAHHELLNATDLQLREHSEEFLEKHGQVKFVRIIIINFNTRGRIDYRAQIVFVGGPKNYTKPPKFRFLGF